MKIMITRYDMLAHVGSDNHKPGVLSTESYDDWESAFASLRARGVKIEDEHEKQFMRNSETQFFWNEFVNAGLVAYMCRVNYEVKVTP
jgi:hypothetical protein